LKIKFLYNKIKLAVLDIYRYFFRPNVVMSNSRLNSYSICPKKYSFYYEEGLKGFPSSYLHFGSAVHAALKEYHEKFDLKGEQGTFDDLMKEYEKVWDELKSDMIDSVSGPPLHRWKVALADSEISDEETESVLNRLTVIYRDDKEEEEFRKLGVKMLEEYFRDNQTNPNKIIALESPLNLTMKGLDLIAYIDRIEKTPEGEIEIVDYKTGKRTKDSESIKLGGDKQSIIYSMMLEKKWKKKLKNFYYYYLSNRTKVPCKLPDRLKENTFSELVETANNIKYQRFDARPGPLCGWCDYEVVCPEWKGARAPFRGIFREARERGRMTFSYSKMGCYKNCPYNYKKLYVDKIAPKPRHFFAIGHSCHETFEDVYKRPYQVSLKQLRKIFEKHWHSEGYPTAEMEQQYFNEGWKWVENYWKKFIDGQYRPAHAVELFFQLPIGNDYVVIGYIDRIDKSPDGKFQIRDYKTDPKMRDQEAVDKDMQLTFYYWAMRQLGIEVDELSLEFLKFNERISTSRSPEDIPAFIEEVNKVVGAMAHAEKEYALHPERGDQLFPPKWNKYCGGCDHLEGCPLENDIRTKYKDKVMNLEDRPETEERHR